MIAYMQNLIRQSLKVKLISMILVSSFTLSALGSEPISVWAQESPNYPMPGMQNANLPPNGMNPCFGPHGNYTGMHSFGQGNYAGTQHIRQGNYTGIHPCSNQTPNPPVAGNNIVPQSTAAVSSTSGAPSPIPSWIKNNAKLWSSGNMDDSTFAQGIQYLIQQKIVNISSTHSGQSTAAGVKIPQWVRNDASSWSSNQIDDSTFVGALQYLIQNGVISP